MPHTKSAKKNLRKTEKRRIRNKTTKKNLRTYLKRFDAVVDGPVDKLQEEYNVAAKRLDKAAAKGVIHRNLASRKKSQLARVLLAKKKAAPPTTEPTVTTPPAAPIPQVAAPKS